MKQERSISRDAPWKVSMHESRALESERERIVAYQSTPTDMASRKR